MQISLKPEQAAFVQTQLASGHYQTAAELVSRALELLQRQSEYEQWLAATRQQVDEGVAALERGEGVAGDVVIAQLRDRLQGH
ncbi:MAG: type II toxin-antitoxin system ParD family antitoxin [Spirulinaceae cyanobacterium RM2_2_10]|nr:type II toxin-antitoxin system ParD family antitoxin [Spirulinaceae cyanobacterium SM2_1_0]NJO18892.1 type II toxin-antitoxin system ParD family antitoxin [Spirulinaceae cyanobacterium RM2_2_10]